MSASRISAFVAVAVLAAWTYNLVELENRKSQAFALLELDKDALASLDTRRWPLIEEALKCLSGTCPSTATYLEEAFKALTSNKQEEEAVAQKKKHQKHYQEAVASIEEHWYLLLKGIVFLLTFFVGIVVLYFLLALLAEQWKLKQARKGQETSKGKVDTPKGKVDTTKGKPNVAPDPQVVVIFKRTWDKHFETSGVLGVCQALGIDTEKYAELIPTIKTKEEFTKKFLGVA